MKAIIPVITGANTNAIKYLLSFVKPKLYDVLNPKTDSPAQIIYITHDGNKTKNTIIATNASASCSTPYNSGKRKIYSDIKNIVITEYMVVQVILSAFIRLRYFPITTPPL